MVGGLVLDLNERHVEELSYNTRAVWDVMQVPPAAPETILTSPVPSSVIMTGQVEDRGLFKGRIKLVGEGGTPNELVTFGELNIGSVTFDKRKYSSYAIFSQKNT